jgi:hypothetical protein
MFVIVWQWDDILSHGHGMIYYILAPRPTPPTHCAPRPPVAELYTPSSPYVLAIYFHLVSSVNLCYVFPVFIRRGGGCF